MAVRDLRPDEAKEGIEPFDVAAAEDVAADAIRAGWLWKRSENSWVGSWQRRWCVLAGYLMYYFESPSSREPKGILSLDGALMQLTNRFKADGKPPVLSIETRSGRQFYFYGKAHADTMGWLEMLPEASPDDGNGAAVAGNGDRARIEGDAVAIGGTTSEGEDKSLSIDEQEAMHLRLARESSLHDEQVRLLREASVGRELGGWGGPSVAGGEGGGSGVTSASDAAEYEAALTLAL